MITLVILLSCISFLAYLIYKNITDIIKDHIKDMEHGGY